MTVTAKPTRDQLRIRIEGIAPTGLSRAQAIEFWQGAAAIAADVKRQELRQGLDKDGRPLARLKALTITHRRSAMGAAEAGAPPLIPALDLSRTIAWLRARSDETGCTLYWAGREGRYSWARVLGFHARIGGYVRGAPIRNVIGVSQGGLDAIAHRSFTWWTSQQKATSPLLTMRMHPLGAGRLPEQPPKPSRLPAPHPESFVVSKMKGSFTASTTGPELLPGTITTGYGRFTTGPSALERQIFDGSPGSNPFSTRSPFAFKTPMPVPRPPAIAKQSPKKPGEAIPPQPVRPSDAIVARIPEAFTTDQKGEAFVEATAKALEELGVKVNRHGAATLRARSAMAVYSPKDREISLNPHQFYWRSPDATMKQIAAKKKLPWMSSDHRDHVAFHELGHALHHLNTYPALPESWYAEWDAAELKSIKGKVSGYAETAPVEFIAEVFAGLRSGKSYDEIVLRLYAAFGGP